MQFSNWEPRQKVKTGTPAARANLIKANSNSSLETSISVSLANFWAASPVNRSGALQPYFIKMSSERSLPSAITNPSIGKYSQSCWIVLVVRGKMIGAPPKCWIKSRWYSPVMSTYLFLRKYLRETQRTLGKRGADNSVICRNRSRSVSKRLLCEVFSECLGEFSLLAPSSGCFNCFRLKYDMYFGTNSY